MTITTKSREEIEALKRDWKHDPCWDIEFTEGFEAHREELRDYHVQCDGEWIKAKQQEETRKAEELGAPANLALAKYILKLERRIEHLENDLAAREYREELAESVKLWRAG